MAKKGLAEDESDKDRSLKSVASSIVTEDIIKANSKLKSVQIERPNLHRLLLFLFLAAFVVVVILRQVVDQSFGQYITS